jgi:putative polyhydroxyalkanoate system protein
MTKAITISVPHELGKPEARRRIDEGFDRFQRQFGDAVGGRFQRRWDGDRLSFGVRLMGQGVTGSLDVLDASVRIELLLPNLLGVIAGKIKSRLQKEGQLLLEKK